MDGTGRILVVTPLRQFASLVKDIVLVGQGEKFELWDAEKWNQEIEAALVYKDGNMPPRAGRVLIVMLGYGCAFTRSAK